MSKDGPKNPGTGKCLKCAKMPKVPKIVKCPSCVFDYKRLVFI